MARTAEDRLQELMSLDESQRIEAKRCTQIDGSAIETVTTPAPDSHQLEPKMVTSPW